MSVTFSRRCEYAIQSVLYLALKPLGEMTSIRVLARELRIPPHFLGKILQNLVQKGILNSQKGPTGGFALRIPPHKVTLFRIVEAIDGTTFSQMCILGFSECTPETPCGVHNHWNELREGISRMMNSNTIADIAQMTRKPEYIKALRKLQRT
jgi:Rrf2 family protein